MADSSTINNEVEMKDVEENNIERDNVDSSEAAEKEDDITEKILNNEEKLQIAEDLYNLGSRSFLLKNYDEACEHLATVCEIYDEIKGTFCDELGMPCLIYGKSLIELAAKETGSNILAVDKNKSDESSDEEDNDNDTSTNDKPQNDKIQLADENIPSSSKGVTAGPSINTDNDEEDGEATILQVAWETLEQAAKIFSNQGEKGLANLADVYTELGNIESQNAGYTNARIDYEKALKILQDLPQERRSLAELHYKIGLTYLLAETQNVSEGLKSFKAACELLKDEIKEIKEKPDLNDKEKRNLTDLEETKDEILNKISDIEEEARDSREKVDAEVRKVLSNFTSPSKADGAASSSSNCDSKAIKPTDISHLIKRKKPESTEAESNEASPAKKPAL